jgi:mRNA interferase MazF
MTRQTPLRGEVWIVDFSPTKGREQAGVRPALVVSADDYNRSPSGLVVVLPITRHSPRVPWHVSLAVGEGGLAEAGSVLCDHLRSISIERLTSLKGSVTYPTLEEVERRLRYLMDL